MIGVAEFLDIDFSCRDLIDLTYEVSGIIFILMQMALLVKYSRVRFNI